MKAERDWADEAAESLRRELHLHDYHHGVRVADRIAAALRDAHARGLREGAAQERQRAAAVCEAKAIEFRALFKHPDLGGEGDWLGMAQGAEACDAAILRGGAEPAKPAEPEPVNFRPKHWDDRVLAETEPWPTEPATQPHGPPAADRDYERRLDSFADLKTGWDSYGADPPSPSAVLLARGFLRHAKGQGREPNNLNPSVVGGVGLTFHAGPRTAYVEFSNTGSCRVLLSHVGGATTAKVFAGGDYESAWERVSGHLAPHGPPAADPAEGRCGGCAMSYPAADQRNVFCLITRPDEPTFNSCSGTALLRRLPADHPCDIDEYRPRKEAPGG